MIWLRLILSIACDGINFDAAFFCPDWDEALSRWEDIIKNSALELERQTALANKARVLIELRRDDQAREILAKVVNEHLAEDKAKLLGVIESDAKNKTQSESK